MMIGYSIGVFGSSAPDKADHVAADLMFHPRPSLALYHLT